jgi:hypothetical protein
MAVWPPGGEADRLRQLTGDRLAGVDTRKGKGPREIGLGCWSSLVTLFGERRIG